MVLHSEWFYAKRPSRQAFWQIYCVLASTFRIAETGSYMNIQNSRDYYGKVLEGSGDLKTDACCTAEAPPATIMAAMMNVHKEVRARYYGCGLVAPQAIEGAHILDLGSGSGQDAFILSQLVGEFGSVTGVDTTPEQLAVANEHLEWQREKFGYAKSNVKFVEGDIEKLGALDLPAGHYDVIVSNCVINLVADKAAVFAAAHRLLKTGGELYFSDVYADRRVPAELLDDPVLHGECLSGALYWGDFHALAKDAGFTDPRLVTSRPLGIGDPAIAEKLDGISFNSATYRLFKLDGLEPECEDYGQAVRYKGTISGSERVFELDGHHSIEAGRMFPICGNSWKMLANTRFAEHFDFFGDFSKHYGVFPGCGTDSPFASITIAPADEAASCC
jgi:arsenite methyltransferase